MEFLRYFNEKIKSPYYDGSDYGYLLMYYLLTDKVRYDECFVADLLQIERLNLEKKSGKSVLCDQ